MYYWVLGIVPDIIFPSQFDLHIENEFVDVPSSAGHSPCGTYNESSKT